MHFEVSYQHGYELEDFYLSLSLAGQIACEMLKSGKVDAVVCVQSDDNDRWE